VPNLGVNELVVVLVLVVLIAGTSRIPKLARALGEARRELRPASQPADEQAGPG